MCGIAGFHLSGRREELEQQLHVCAKQLSHRGPDFTGYYISEDVFFTHTRLSILDLSPAANQPFEYLDGQIVISFNGEIYNYRQLKSQLQAEGYQFRTNSDTEVLAAAYSCWGNSCFKKLEGMFAVALFDQRKHKIILARDVFGKKPLYYSNLNGLVFSSELGVFKTILHGLKIDPVAVNHFLSIGYLLDPLSPFEDVFILPPASILQYNLDNRTISISNYYVYADAFRQKHQHSLQAAAQQVLTLLQQSVEKRRMGDVPMGLFLSGGLDSAALASINAKQGNKIPCFTFGFEDKKYDEASDAVVLCKRLHLNHQVIRLPDLDLQDILHFFNRMDYLTFDNSSLPVNKLAEYASKEVKFVLTGDGSDEIFGGYATYTADRWNQRLKPIIPFLKSRPVFALLNAMLKRENDGVGFRTKASRFLHGMDISAHLAHYRWRLIFSPNERIKLMGEDYRNLIIETDPYHHFEQLYKSVQDLDPVDQHLYVDSLTWLSSNNLIKLDRNTMAYGLEARCPYLDKELTTYVAGCSVDFKRNKLLLKTALKDSLPEVILHRPKTGFNAPMGGWLSSAEDEFQAYTSLLASYQFPEFIRFPHD